MSAWGVKSAGGVVSIAKSEEQAREWAAYDYKMRIGYVAEELTELVDDEWKVAA